MVRGIIILLALALCISLTGLLYGAENKTATATPVAPAATTPSAARPIPRPNFAMVSGTITKIDTTDPANVKLEVQSEIDNQVHVIGITPWTNVTKVTDVSELKVGDSVRVMSRKMEDKEVAMGVMFGKIRRMPTPGPMGGPAAMGPSTMPPAGPTATAAQQTTPPAPAQPPTQQETAKK